MQTRIRELKDKGFIDKQTRSIVMDMVVYNKQTQFFTVINFVAVFEANGLITTDIELFNLKKNYYQEVAGYFRLVCEVCFTVLLVFYWIIEVAEIAGEIAAQKKEYDKEQKKRMARENRRREMLEAGAMSLEKTPEIGRNAK